MGKKQKVILSLGANENQESNMQLAQYKLERLLSNQVIFSEMMWTTPIGIDSDRFLNCLAVAHTHHSFTQLHRALKQIERSLGDSRYHIDDWQRNYVRRLLERMGEKTSVEN